MESLITADLLIEHKLLSSFIIIISLIGFLLKFISSLINFYEDVLLRRYFKRLKYLSEFSQDDSSVSEFIKALKENEAFKIASGIKVYPEKAEMLMGIYKLGIADSKELKKVQRYINPKGSLIDITIKKADKILILHSLFSAIVIWLLGIIVAVPLVYQNIMSAIIGFIFLFLCTFVAAFLATDFRRYRTILRIKKSLKQKNKLAQSDYSTKLYIFWKVAQEGSEPS